MRFAIELRTGEMRIPTGYLILLRQYYRYSVSWDNCIEAFFFFLRSPSLLQIHVKIVCCWIGNGVGEWMKRESGSKQQTLKPVKPSWEFIKLSSPLVFVHEIFHNDFFFFLKKKVGSD